jgi:3-deoxy-7-phosphoheptulonate synthase
MVVIMDTHATADQLDAVASRLRSLGLAIHPSTGRTRTVIGVIGDTAAVDVRDISGLPGVQEVVRVSEPYKLASRAFKEDDTVIRLGGVTIGGTDVVVMAGPCSVESEHQVEVVAETVKAAGATILRGGAFKPRTSPYSFQGLGEEGLKILRRVADRFGLLVISEVMDVLQVPLCQRYVDILQIGARNMQNFTLLKELARCRRPILLKRAMSATIDEWLMAAEYLMSGGNTEVILCERGIRTFETRTRNTLDLCAVPVVKHLSHLPVIVDPSHSTGLRDKVLPMARAAIAAGADGIIVEVHHDPDNALCDGAQSLYPKQFRDMMVQLGRVTQAVGRGAAWMESTSPTWNGADR